MQELTLSRITGRPISLNYFPLSGSNEAVIFVGGSGDTRNTFNALVLELQKRTNRPVVTFSFSGVEENKQPTLNQQTSDLLEILQYSKSMLKFSSIAILCTSMGAYSTTEALLDKQFDPFISKVVFIDPADYYITEAQSLNPKTWSGFESYNPNKETISQKLAKISSSVIIDVIHSFLRNHGPNGYLPVADRGSDKFGYFPRLSTLMVKSFFDFTPDKNKGSYIEDEQIPHAFMRDGDIDKNIVRIVELIGTCLV
ncbi:MAG: hypothetical protein WC775_00660 [Patescibacteria group bacterium]|jgi:uncharacterized alpha/beta hydrolase family protein